MAYGAVKKFSKGKKPLMGLQEVLQRQDPLWILAIKASVRDC